MIWQVINLREAVKKAASICLKNTFTILYITICTWTLLSIKYIVRFQKTYRAVSNTKSNKLHVHGKNFPPQRGQLAFTNYPDSIVTQQLTKDDTNLSSNLLPQPPFAHYPQSSKTVLCLTINEFFLCFWLPFLAWKKLWYVFKSSVLSR